MHGWWAASYVVLWGVVVMLCLVVVALARQIGTLHLRLGPRGALEIDEEGPALGAAPPPFQTTDIDGAPVTIGGPGEAQLLLFVSPGCGVCKQVLPSVGVVAATAHMTPYVLTDAGGLPADGVLASRPATARVVPATDIAPAYAVPGTPFVVALDDQGVVRAKGLVNNLEQMEGLIDSARRRVTTQAHPEVVP